MKKESVFEKVLDVLESTICKVLVAILTIVLTYGWLTNWTFELAIQTAR